MLTLIGVSDAEAAGQKLAAPAEGYRLAVDEVTLEPGGERKTVDFCLFPPKGETLAAKPGDTLTFKLRLTRGALRAPRVRLKLGDRQS